MAQVRRLDAARQRVEAIGIPGDLTAAETVLLIYLFERFKHRQAHEVLLAANSQRMERDPEYHQAVDTYLAAIRGERASDFKLLQSELADAALSRFE